MTAPQDKALPLEKLVDEYMALAQNAYALANLTLGIGSPITGKSPDKRLKTFAQEIKRLVEQVPSQGIHERLSDLNLTKDALLTH